MEQPFPESDESVRATIARVLELKGLASEGQLLRMASVSIHHTDHDSWNGGVDYYALNLRVPLEVFVQIEAEIEQHEKRILEVAKSVWRDFESDIISAIHVVPDRAASSGVQSTAVMNGHLPSFWDEGQFRLFVSHCSSKKVDAGQLKAALNPLGVAAFVAHDDIEPSLIWQAEIERALRTCEALTAVISEDFVTSFWCDQEVGYALGRSVPVFPIQCGRPPHGFIGKVQALPLRHGETLASRASVLVGLLLQAPQTAASMTTALVRACAEACSFANAKAATIALEMVPSLSEAHIDRLNEGLNSNSQITSAFGVPERLRGILKRHAV